MAHEGRDLRISSRSGVKAEKTSDDELPFFCKALIIVKTVPTVDSTVGPEETKRHLACLT